MSKPKIYNQWNNITNTTNAGNPIIPEYTRIKNENGYHLQKTGETNLYEQIQSNYTEGISELWLKYMNGETTREIEIEKGKYADISQIPQDLTTIKIHTQAIQEIENKLKELKNELTNNNWNNTNNIGRDNINNSSNKNNTNTQTIQETKPKENNEKTKETNK